MKKRQLKSISEARRFAAYLFIFLLALALFVKDLSKSLFFNKKDRINILFYGQTASLYSISLSDNIDYVINFYPDLKVLVPGGYQYYRVGALGKLVNLEHKKGILPKTFSSASSSIVDFYFYPSLPAAYYGISNPEKTKIPGLRELFLDSSNAGIFDRIYLYSQFFVAQRRNLNRINDIPILKKNNELYLSEEEFAKQSQGIFFNKSYRTEKKTVQIVYSDKVANAVLISRILEGSGIRVVDYSQDNSAPKNCSVVEETVTFSKTSKDLSRFFGCKLTKGRSFVSDIIVRLGEKEKEWAAE